MMASRWAGSRLVTVGVVALLSAGVLAGCGKDSADETQHAADASHTGSRGSSDSSGHREGGEGTARDGDGGDRDASDRGGEDTDGAKSRGSDSDQDGGDRAHHDERDGRAFDSTTVVTVTSVMGSAGVPVSAVAAGEPVPIPAGSSLPDQLGQLPAGSSVPPGVDAGSSLPGVGAPPAPPAPGAPPAPAAPPAPPAAPAQSLQQLADRMAASAGHHIQVALDNGFTHAYAGSGAVYPSWSTVKVALSIAAQRAHSIDNATVERAITASDNNAAAAIWNSLGSGAQASAKATAVLRDGGDATTVVQGQRVRPPFSAFGQTMWPAANQATFGRNLTCIAGSGYVTGAMARVIPGQSYGLGQIRGAHFKGGWGPDPAGAYTVRQFGYIQLPNGGVIGVSLVARPTDGTYPGGQLLLNEAASVLNTAITTGAISARPAC